MKLSDIFSETDMFDDISGVMVDGNWNIVKQTGFVKLKYMYKGLKVYFVSQLYSDYKKDIIKIYTKLYGFSEYIEIDKKTFMNENIPSLEPLKLITKIYSIENITKLVCNYIYKFGLD